MRNLQLIDLGLLTALDLLIETESVTMAAERLGRSVPAMSRTLARLRLAVGDPLLVRAGRGLVATPRALALKPRVAALVAEARAVLTPDSFSPARLDRQFTLRASEDLAMVLAAPLLARIAAQAPGVRLRLLPEGEEQSDALRDGRIDLDIGARGDDWAPEIVTRTVLHLPLVGFARPGHPRLPALAQMEVFAAAGHVAATRRGVAEGPIDMALAAHGLARQVLLTVPSATAALAVVAHSDLVTAAPALLAAHLSLDVAAFPLPVPTPPMTLAISWHPRVSADPAHGWLRGEVAAALADLAAPASGQSAPR